MNDWKPLGEIPRNSLIELRNKDGVWFLVGPHNKGVFRCERVGEDTAAYPGDLTDARVLDLEFLLACAADRLEENEVYQRGKKDGAEIEREACALAAETHRVLHGDQDGGYAAPSDDGKDIARSYSQPKEVAVMSDNWTTLDLLNGGALFETEDGLVGIKQHNEQTIYNKQDVYVITMGSGYARPFPWYTKVREIDLPFLLLVASDRLEENAAYQRGKRDGWTDGAQRAIEMLLLMGAIKDSSIEAAKALVENAKQTNWKLA